MKAFVLRKKYILIPVNMDAPCETVEIWNEEKKLFEFEIPVANCQCPYLFHYYAALNMEKWKGQKISIRGNCPQAFLEAIGYAEDVVKTEQHKPRIHFAPESGWINDPNGLVYSNGVYHLFFQFNPFQNQWGNLCWGHATSKDLLHWEQLDTAMYPDENGSKFSGCCIINEYGLLDLPDNALVFLYTLAGGQTKWSKGKKFTQNIAFSVDNGKTLQKIEQPVLKHLVDENRDPKVYWHEETKAYYMVLFLEGNQFGIFRSTDLKEWECTQTIELDSAWECPDLREIPVEGGGKKWVFWSADGFYFLGDFDGYHFTTDGVRREAYQTPIPYAAQTFWGTLDVISIPWLRTQNHGKYYRGVMGLPRKLTLVSTNDGWRLRMMPTESFLEARKLVFMDNTCELKYKPDGFKTIQIQLLGAGSIRFSAELDGNQFVFDAETGDLTVNGQSAFMGKNVHEMSILIDAEICEVTTENGLYYGVFELNAYQGTNEWTLKSKEMLSMKVMEI